MKARIALEAIKEQKTIEETASHYEVHPSQVTNWKRRAIQERRNSLRICGRSRTPASKR
jgi:transposase